MSIVLVWGGYLVVAVLVVLVDSVFEWTLHRFVMHRPVGKFFKFPFEKHTLTHHHVFRADESYHCSKDSDKRTIRMAWWIGPVLIGALLLPVAAITVPLGFWSVLVIFGIVSGVYFSAYEYTHWCMHLPKARRRRLMEQCGGMAFRFLNGHHLLHHRYMGKNLNVVFPFADIIFGTLLIRAPKPFPQPWGPSVPNVQPLTR